MYSYIKIQMLMVQIDAITKIKCYVTAVFVAGACVFIGHEYINDHSYPTLKNVSEYDHEKTTRTHCRPTHGTVKKSHRTLTVTRHEECN